MVCGALLIDKPSGCSSHDVVRRIRRALNLKRVGHAGTLDPLATGLLVVLLGKATQFQPVFLEQRKRYEGIIRLGLSTDTDDISGRVLAEDRHFRYAEGGSLPAIAARLAQRFSGPQLQLPPRYSAIHVAGRRAYELARKGEEFDMKARPVEITVEEFRFLDRERLAYRVHVSSGTYIRSLAHDIGVELATGACIETIRRTSSGEFLLVHAVPLEEFETAVDKSRFILSPEQLVRGLAHIDFDAAESARLRCGVQTPLHRLSAGDVDSGFLAIFDENECFLALAKKVSQTPPWKLCFVMERGPSY